MTRSAEVPGTSLNVTKGDIVLTAGAWSDTVIKVTVTGPFSTGVRLTEAVIGEPRFPAVEVAHHEDRHTLRTGSVSVDHDERTGELSFRRPDGELLTALKNCTPALSPRPVFAPLQAEEEAGDVSGGADGIRVATAPHRERKQDRVAYSGTLDFVASAGEHLFGLGQHDEGEYDLRGTRQHLYQHNTKISLPVLVSSRGYAIFVDCGSAIDFMDDDTGFHITCRAVDRLEFYVIVGHDLDALVRGIQDLTGVPPMLPKALLGYVQSKERYVDEAEVLETVQEFQRRAIPLSVIVLDWQTWPGKQWGQKSLDPARFPDPQRMVDAVHDAGVAIMFSIWPKMAGGGSNEHEFRDAGLLLGDGATYDAFSQDAQDMYWRQLDDGIGRFGFDYWWADCAEPFEADWEGAEVGDADQRAELNIEFAERFIDAGHILEYSMHHVGGLHRHHSAASDRRFGVLTRSSFPGQQRLGAIAWSGDTGATWQELRSQVVKGLNLVVTGQPYWTFDIGGFFAVTRPEYWFWRGIAREGGPNPEYTELYVRWCQLGALIPVMRSHGTDLAREPWQFGDVGDPAYEAIVSAIALRRTLLPYLYASMADTDTGRVSYRMLPFDFPNDPESYEVSDQFMLGRDLLCAPVLDPAEEGGSTRRVWLPRGCDWYEFGGAGRHPGGVWLEVDVELGDIPLFVREGSIIPKDVDGTLVLEVYPGRDGSGHLYDDDGETMRYRDGEFSRRRVTWSDTDRILTMHPDEGNWRGFAQAIRATAVDGGTIARAHTCR